MRVRLAKKRIFRLRWSLFDCISRVTATNRPHKKIKRINARTENTGLIVANVPVIVSCSCVHRHRTSIADKTRSFDKQSLAAENIKNTEF